MEKSRPDRKEKRKQEPKRKARRGWECPREKAHKSGREKREEDGKE